MKITWLGHACFKIEKGDYTVIIDPYKDGYVPGYTPIREKANMVLCTHDHLDHSAEETVELVSFSDECPFKISAIESFHDDRGGELRGRTGIIILDDGKKRIAHLGDLGCDLTDEQKQILYGVDYLLIPVGGYYTIDARQAAVLTAELNVGHAIPMHYRSVESQFGMDELGTVYDYAAIVPGGARILAINNIYTEVDIPERVIVLQPQNIPENAAD